MKPQDIADLKQLIEFLKEHQVAEFDLDRGDLKIRLKFNQPEARRRAGRSGPVARIGSCQRGSAAAARAPAAAPAAAAGPAAQRTRMRACTWSSRPSSAHSTARLRPAQRPLFPPATT